MSDRSAEAADGPRGSQRRHAAIALACALGMLAICAARYAVLAIRAIRYPYGIDYGEGIVWHQMHMALAGTAYGPIEGFPAIAFPYPPLYYFASFAAAQITGMDELAAGRLLSVISALIAAAAVAAIAPRLVPGKLPGRARAVLAVMAGLMTICTQPILDWSILMRVDLLFVAFSFIGLYFGIRALTQPGYVVAAALLFVAAIFVKQIAISAPIAVFGVMLVVRPRTAIVGIATTLAVGLAALIPLMIATDGGFLRHVVYYTITEFTLTQLSDLLIIVATHLIYLLLALTTIVARLRRMRAAEKDRSFRALKEYLRQNPTEAAFLMVAVYFSIATALLLTVLKTGSTINYFLEWTCLIALLTTVGLADVAGWACGATGHAGRPRLRLAAAGTIVIQAFALFWLTGIDFREKAAHRDEIAQLVAIVGSAEKPIVSDDMVALLRAGKPVLWEPFIFAELAKKGAWDEGPFLARIRSHAFSFFVIEGRAGDGGPYDERYTSAVTEALDAAYPQRRKLGDYELRFPSGPLPAYAARLRPAG